MGLRLNKQHHVSFLIENPRKISILFWLSFAEYHFFVTPLIIWFNSVVICFETEVTHEIWTAKNIVGLHTRLGRFWKTLYIQLFLGRPCICKSKKCHSSPQKSKPRAGACLEEASLDQSGIRPVKPWSVIGPDLLLQVKLRAWVLTSVLNYGTF